MRLLPFVPHKKNGNFILLTWILTNRWIMNNDLEVAHSRSGSSSTIPSRVGIQNWVLREKPLGAKERTTSNSNHIWRRRRDLNLGHDSGRRVLSLLLHPCSPIVLAYEWSIECGSQIPVRTFPGPLFDRGLSNHDAHAPTKTGIVSRFSVLWLTSYDAYIFSSKLPVLLCVHPLISQVYETKVN